MRYYLVILIFSFLSCNKPCIYDKEFEKKFNEEMKTVEHAVTLLEKNFPDNSSYSINEMTDAVLFLEAVTGIRATDFDPENAIFHSQGNPRKDIRKWKKWYKEQGCSMTIIKADSLYLNHAGSGKIHKLPFD